MRNKTEGSFRMSKYIAYSLYIALLLLLFCSKAFAIRVLVTIPPQKEWVESIGGKLVEVGVLVPAGFDPHGYELKPSQLKAVEKAEVYFTLGAGIEFERLWLGRIRDLNHKLLVVDLSQGIPLIPDDPHYWCSLMNAYKALKTIETTLCRLSTMNCERLKGAYGVYSKRVLQLHQKLSVETAPYRGRAFLSYHPAWGYWARDYGLRQMVIEEEGKEPSLKVLLKRIEEAKKEGVKVLFVTPQVDRRRAETIAKELGAEIRVLDPLRGDYLRNIQEVSEEILRSLRKEKGR